MPTVHIGNRDAIGRGMCTLQRTPHAESSNMAIIRLNKFDVFSEELARVQVSEFRFRRLRTALKVSFVLPDDLKRHDWRLNHNFVFYSWSARVVRCPRLRSSSSEQSSSVLWIRLPIVLSSSHALSLYRSQIACSQCAKLSMFQSMLTSH